MKLSLHGLPDLDGVTEADIERIIGGGDFGMYAALGDREGDFIQVGLKSNPPPWAFEYAPGTWERQTAEAWKAFKDRTGSEPWGLDYYDSAKGEQYEAEGDRTLEEVRRAFSEYLQGDDAFKSRYNWIKMQDCDT
jgi:hypothetical protein